MVTREPEPTRPTTDPISRRVSFLALGRLPGATAGRMRVPLSATTNAWIAYAAWLSERFGLPLGVIGALAIALGIGELAAAVGTIAFSDRMGQLRSARYGLARRPVLPATGAAPAHTPRRIAPYHRSVVACPSPAAHRPVVRPQNAPVRHVGLLRRPATASRGPRCHPVALAGLATRSSMIATPP